MRILYTFWQWTWGIIQTFTGFVVFLLFRKCPHYFFHGALVTEWNRWSSVSLGWFIFVADEKRHGWEDQFRREEVRKVVVHEYGHTIQSLILGPLYFVVVGLPSGVWCNSKRCEHKRCNEHISYYSFPTERSANHLGEKVSKEKAPEETDG